MLWMQRQKALADEPPPHLSACREELDSLKTLVNRNRLPRVRQGPGTDFLDRLPQEDGTAFKNIAMPGMAFLPLFA